MSTTSSLIHYPVHLTVTLLTNNSAENNFRSVQANWSVITNISTQSAADNSIGKERSLTTCPGPAGWHAGFLGFPRQPALII